MAGTQTRFMSDPTPYPDVNETLHALLIESQAVLGDHFIGLYLYGSLATGDFNPETSDIDFIVVSDDEIPAETVDALGALYTRLTASGLKWVAKLEGSFLSRRALRRQQDDTMPCPQIKDGTFQIESHGYDWIIQRDVLYKQGCIVTGPAPQTLIDPISPDELREAVLGVFHSWWELMLNDPSWLQPGEYQVFGVLSMCRVLYTLQYGLIESKPVCARWAQQIIREHAWLIEQAVTWTPDISFDHLDETLALIRYTQAEIALFESENVDD